MNRLIVVGLLVLTGAGPELTAGGHRAPTLEIYNVPGFTNAQGHGISPTGTISGNYQAAGLGNHGYLFDGTEYRTLDVPLPGFGTFYVRTSPTGDAVVAAGAPTAGRVGFFYRHTTGEFDQIVGPPNTGNVTPWGINAQGDIVGSHTVPAPHAFLLRNGDFSDIHVPFAGATSSAALDINAQGDVVGRYVGANGRRMFLRTRQGDYQSIEYPGAVATGLVGEPGGINDKGDIVGPILEGSKTKGFLLDAGGFQVIDFPNTDFVVPADIDNHGNIVGTLRITGSNRMSAFILRR